MATESPNQFDNKTNLLLPQTRKLCQKYNKPPSQEGKPSLTFSGVMIFAATLFCIVAVIRTIFCLKNFLAPRRHETFFDRVLLFFGIEDKNRHLRRERRRLRYANNDDDISSSDCSDSSLSSGYSSGNSTDSHNSLTTKLQGAIRRNNSSYRNSRTLDDSPNNSTSFVQDERQHRRRIRQQMRNPNQEFSSTFAPDQITQEKLIQERVRQNNNNNNNNNNNLDVNQNVQVQDLQLLQVSQPVIQDLQQPQQEVIEHYRTRHQQQDVIKESEIEESFGEDQETNALISHGSFFESEMI